MSRETAGSIYPFEGGFAISIAIEAGGIFDHPITAVTVIDDGMAFAPVIRASFLRHKDALRSYLHRLTHHDDLLPSRFFNLAKTQKKSSSLTELSDV